MASGGGGGGSSKVFVAGTASSIPSSRTGDGQVTITFDPATDACPSPAAAPAAVVATPKFTG
jgi:hypothetical protein